MITTVGDLLQALICTERDKLNEYSLVQHPGIIGDMYEGLAREVTQRAILPGADLRVVRGKIRNTKGALSRQIDCMIVHRDGERVPYTDHWIYDVSSVLAVVEVKKTLYGKDLSEALDLFIDLWRRVCEPREMPSNLLRDAWRSIHGTDLPSKATLETLRPAEQNLYHALVVEANLPLRVVLGFEGYSSEVALRQGFLGFLTSRLESARDTGVPLGPVGLPSLIIANHSSLIKLNGMPYPGPYWSSDASWGFYGSRGSNPIHVLLELLWTRLTYYYAAPPGIFGEDLDLEAVNLLLRGRFVDSSKQRGWALEAIEVSSEELRDDSGRSWEPATLTHTAFVVTSILSRQGSIDLSDEAFLKFLRDEGRSLEELVAELTATRLVYLRDNQLRLLTDQCACVMVPGIGYVAAENKSGRLERWLLRHLHSQGVGGTPST